MFYRSVIPCCTLTFFAILVLCLHQCNANNINNTTTANNSSRPSNETEKQMQEKATAFDRFQIFFCILVMVVGFSGNFLVILLFTIRCSRLKTCEVFMVSLAFADLIGTFTIPLDILRVRLRLNTVSGDFIACQFPTWLGTTCLSVSAITLVAIAVDRFMIVAWPLRIRYSNSITVYVLVAVTWLIGGSFGFNYFFWKFQLYDDDTSTYHCADYHNVGEEQFQAHTIALFILQMALPISIMIVLYSFIACKLRSGSVSARRLSETDNVTRIRSRRQRKATKLFVTVVMTFYVLVLPSNIFHLLSSFGHIKFSLTVLDVYHVLTLIQLSNSCVNPIIYSRLHKSFRKSTMSLLFGCCFPKYWRYDWNSKYISRSSYLRRRRSTAYTHSQYINTVRGSPCPEEAPNFRGSTPSPRGSAGASSRLSRISSSGSDDVFFRKPSLKVGFCKDEENVKIHLDQIPEQNSVLAGPRNGDCSKANKSPSSIGKYTRFSNVSTDGIVSNGRQISQDSTNTRLSSAGSQRSNSQFDNIQTNQEQPNYQIEETEKTVIDSDDVQL